MDNQKISMPTEAEKQRAIARILDAGLPRRVAFGRELREVLGEDIPLNAPDVAEWIKAFLAEQTEELSKKE